MYDPKQIPYLLNKTFKENVEYIEYHMKELEAYCMCIWQMRSKHLLENTIYNTILPDACIDIIIDFSNQSICFAGFSKDTEQLELRVNVDYMGVRLKPGAFYSLFQIEADHIMDHAIPFAQIENEIGLERILLLQDVPKRLDMLKTYLEKKIQKASDKRWIEMVDQLYSSPKEQSVLDIANHMGYHKRHLVRIFKKYYGVSPKVLLNIIRLHLCLTLLLEEKKELGDIAMICGFYDQSHFIKEIKKYTGISPVELLKSNGM